MKVFFAGAQGTGKTTLINIVETGLEKIQGITRKTIKNGSSINENGDTNTQDDIFKAYNKAFEDKDNFISERGLIDVFSYSMYLYERGKMDHAVMQNHYEGLKSYHEKNKDIVYFYLPPEFPIENDGTRSVDPEYQKYIDHYISKSLEWAEQQGSKVYRITGSVEERKKKIEEIINK